MDLALAPPYFHDLQRFELSDMIELGAALRQVAPDANTMEEAGSALVQYLYEHLAVEDSNVDDPCASPENRKNCALVRLFKTHRFVDLEPEQKEFARNAVKPGDELKDDTRCLTLLATAGSQPNWNHRLTSAGHKAIPLTSEEVVRQAPMVFQLIQQMGVEIADVVHARGDLILDSNQQTFNVFHVADALGSPYVPAQDFVRENGVKSVIGFGGLFPTGDLFAVILFSRVYVPRETAEMCRTLALCVKFLLLPFVRGQVFSKVV
jgi:hypothetical protein